MKKNPSGIYTTRDGFRVKPEQMWRPSSNQFQSGYRISHPKIGDARTAWTLDGARSTIANLRKRYGIEPPPVKRTVRRKRKPIDEAIANAETRVAEWRRKRKLADTKLAGWERKLEAARKRKIAALEAQAERDAKKIRRFDWSDEKETR